MGLARIWKHRYTHSHAATHVNSIVTKKVWWFLKKLHTELPYEWLYIVILWGIYVFQRTESICPHKNLCTNVYSGIIHNSEEVGTTQRFTKLWHIHTNLKKTDDHPAITVLKYWGMLQLGWTLKPLCYVKEVRHKRHTAWFLFYEISTTANPERQKADWWLPGDWEGMENVMKKLCS